MRYTALDAIHWNSELDTDERTFLSAILAFLFTYDALVAEKVAQKFFAEVQVPEARCFYGLQIMMYSFNFFAIVPD